MYLVVAMYKSKYGLILYCSKLNDVRDAETVDLNNVYLNTLYFKGREVIKVGEVYEFSTIKGENGYTYCFLV